MVSDDGSSSVGYSADPTQGQYSVLPLALEIVNQVGPAQLKNGEIAGMEGIEIHRMVPCHDGETGQCCVEIWFRGSRRQLYGAVLAALKQNPGFLSDL